MVANIISTNEQDIVTKALQNTNITHLNQLQIDSINAGLLEDQNFVIALPTGSGKTLLTIIKSEEMVKRGQKVIYLTPTRALNKQIYHIFRKIYFHTYRIQGGMNDSHVKEALKKFQILVSTLEKFEIELPKNPNVLDNVGLIVVDEIHLLSDRQRGPTYEFMISRILYLQERDKWIGQIIGLSGSIHNPHVIAFWMKAGYIYTKERINPFQSYVVDIDIELNSLLLYSKSDDKNEFLLDNVSILQIATQSLPCFNLEILYSEIPEKYLRIIITCLYLIKENQRALILCPTQGQTVMLNRVMLKAIDILKWQKINSLFHHAGAPEDHKKTVELLCNLGSIDCVFTTTTFAMGMDYPFDAVILTFHSLYDRIFDWKDNDIKQRKEFSVSQILMIQQIIGRVGHQPGSSAFVYFIGETFAEGLDIYERAIEYNPSIQSNFNTYVGKMKFQEVLNVGCISGWLNNIQDIIDFGNLTLYSTLLISAEIDHKNPNLIKNMKNVLYDEINDFLFNPLICLKYQDFPLDNKILMIRQLISDSNLEDLTIITNPNLFLHNKNNVSPKQIFDFLLDFDKLYIAQEINIDNMYGIVKLMMKTDHNLIIQIGKLSPTLAVGRYGDKEVQQLSKILSPIRKIDYYLSTKSNDIKINAIELRVLKRINNLLHVFSEVINEQIYEYYLFSEKTHNAIPYLKMHFTSAFNRITNILKLNS